MNRVVVLVRPSQLFLLVQQSAEPVVRAQLKIDIHLGGLERAHLDANLAAHAYRHIDVESRWINLGLADKIRLLVLAFLDIDTLRRALFLADLARHAAQPRLPIAPVIYQERKDARRLDPS